ncbi:TrmH family RNA methyltransferase [Promicromonospora sp. NPDC023987]|uniref:TrmH family RNA methyltransferase n=1 Tax=Promicromonospora sp. NPDC023987 TaxID=3155360 RepID=UPI0033EC5E89
MSTTSTDQTERGSTPRGEGDALIDRREHPLARRVTDVLRSRNQGRNLFLIDDEENILQAVRAGVRLDSLFLSDTARADDAAAAARRAGIPVYRLPDAVSKDLFGVERHARVFAIARDPRRATLGDLVDRSGDVVVLDGVRLAGNIGAITRTARALGAAGIVLLDSGMNSVLDRRLIRASRGLVFTLPVVLSKPAELQRHLREQEIPLVTLAADGTEHLEDISHIPGRVALVMGSERTGASRRLNEVATHKLAIPMVPEVESLNVSVATALALWERRRARSGPSSG